jgi:hypothetical protein
MKFNKKSFIVGLSFALVGVLTVGCSSGTTETNGSEDVVQNSTVVADDMGLDDEMMGEDDMNSMDSPEEEIVGADPSSWAPVVLTSQLSGQSIDMRPGQSGIFVELPDDSADTNIVVESSDPVAVKPVQREDQGSYQTQPGITAQKVGKSTISVLDGFPADGEAELLYEFTVNVITE